MQVEPVRLLSDNYAYLLTQPGCTEAVIVDPSEAAPLLERLQQRGLTLHAVLATHHHADHIGGVEALVARYPDAAVVGSLYDRDHHRIPHLSQAMADGDRFAWRDVTLEALHVPAHTLGALAYFGAGCLFSGDTWFIGGCGRVFEGTYEQMHAALARLACLPPETHLYCGHEYAVKNLAFCAAHALDPEPATLRLAAMKAQLQAGRPSVPATIAEELATNVFVDCPLQRFTALRNARNEY